MKNKLKILAMLFVSLFAFTMISCSDDDDPVDNDFFVGTYRGSVGFTSTSETKSSDNGSVTVVKVGDKYNFRFSEGIENITGIEFRNEGDNVYVNVGGDESSYIRIDANTLRILYSKDDKIWTADCTR